MFVGGLSAIALGVYTAKGATSVTARYIEARIGIQFCQLPQKPMRILLRCVLYLRCFVTRVSVSTTLLY